MLSSCKDELLENDKIVLETNTTYPLNTNKNT